jgi:lipoprotein-releasing system permease protein
MIVVFLQSQYHLFPLDTSVYIIPAVPVEIHWWDLFSISAASLGLSYLASYYPAKRAAATLPADALRWE